MRVRKWLLLLAVFALLAAACGDDDDAESTTTAATTATTAATTTTTEAGGVQTITEGVLTVGSDIPFIPFEDYDDAGNVVGFDADLVDEMATRLDLDVEWIDTDFDTIFTQLATGRFDIVASATTITPERAQQVNFTVPYYKAQQALTINEDLTPNIRSWEDLSEGDSVAAQTGTTGLDWALENLAPLGVEVREFPQAPDTYNALEGGQVTGVIFDEPSAVAEAANRPGLAVVQAIDTNENYGFGVDGQPGSPRRAQRRVHRHAERRHLPGDLRRVVPRGPRGQRALRAAAATGAGGHRHGGQSDSGAVCAVGVCRGDRGRW